MRAALKDTDVGLANGKAISEREVHVVMDDMANAIRAKDVDALMAHYAPDVLTFDLLPRCNTRGPTRSEKGCRSGFRRSRAPSVLRCAI